MNRREYRTVYLKSVHWLTFRAKMLSQYDRCQECGLTNTCCLFFYGHGLDIHHKTYKRLGSERPEDVQVLCRACHELAEDAKYELGHPHWFNHFPHFKGYPGLIEFPCPDCGEWTGVVLFKYGGEPVPPKPLFWDACECRRPYYEDDERVDCSENASEYIEKHFSAIQDWRMKKASQSA